MSDLQLNDFEDENVIEVEENFDAPSSRKISNSIHDFSEIMGGGNTGKHSERFSGAYNPKRRKLLTEINKDNIIDTEDSKEPK